MNTTTLTPQTATFVDHRRLGWLLASGLTLMPFVGIGLREALGSDLWLFVPTLVLYVLLPLADAVIGADRSNPAESDVPSLEADPFYRRVVYLSVPLLYLTLVAGAWYAMNADLSWYGYLGIAIAIGWTAGVGINVGHELGHKRSVTERRMAQLALAPAAYGHFCIEHNQGHHRDVATPEDPASARLGESYYRFMVREIPGALMRAWRLEQARLAREHRESWSIHNQILQTAILTAVVWGGLLVWLGAGVLPLLLVQAVVAYSLLSAANYIEHYGLLRQKTADGGYERPRPEHSWNSNHVLSNILLYQLQRHSDHHAHAARRYQALRHFDEAPQLPSGYFGMYLLAYLPPLWFRVMDPRVLDHAGYDAARINLDPARRDRLVARYGLADKAAAQE
ncbi:MAG: alkane 1-monooxygenase [Gammaproteobacteria bacterium]